jgi:TetR/AcrR family transcriptional regulator
MDTPTTPVDETDLPIQPGRRPRPKPGERRLQILQAVAEMLQTPGGERVTTAALSARLGVSEAALYRHFASKADMFEGLIDFIEQSVFGLIQQISDREPSPLAQVPRVVAMVLQFCEKNPGMARVMAGDALVLENERLTARMNLLFDKLESALKQRLRDAGHPQAPVLASALTAFVMGRVQRFVRSGFRRSAIEQLDACLSLLLLD